MSVKRSIYAVILGLIGAACWMVAFVVMSAALIFALGGLYSVNIKLSAQSFDLIYASLLFGPAISIFVSTIVIARGKTQ